MLEKIEIGFESVWCVVGPLGAERIADALRKGGAPRLRELDLTANTLGLCVCVCLSVYVSECLFSRKLNPNSPTHTHTHTHTCRQLRRDVHHTGAIVLHFARLLTTGYKDDDEIIIIIM